MPAAARSNCRLTPAADGAPLEELFTVAPDATVPTVYTAEIAPDRSEAIVENNARSVLVNPPDAAAGC